MEHEFRLCGWKDKCCLWVWRLACGHLQTWALLRVKRTGVNLAPVYPKHDTDCILTSFPYCLFVRKFILQLVTKYYQSLRIWTVTNSAFRTGQDRTGHRRQCFGSAGWAGPSYRENPGLAALSPATAHFPSLTGNYPAALVHYRP